MNHLKSDFLLVINGYMRNFGVISLTNTEDVYDAFKLGRLSKQQAVKIQNFLKISASALTF